MAQSNKIQFSGQIIQRFNSIKYVGIVLHNKLPWAEQIQSVLSQIVKYANAFKMLKHIVPYKCNKPLYFAYIYARGTPLQSWDPVIMKIPLKLSPYNNICEWINHQHNSACHNPVEATDSGFNIGSSKI